MEVLPVSNNEAVRSVQVTPQGRVVSGPAVTFGQPGAWPDTFQTIARQNARVMVIDFQCVINML